MADLAIKRLRFTGKACASPTAVDHVRPPVPAAGQVLVAVHAVCLVQMDMPKLGCAFSGTVVFAPPAPSTGDSTTQIVPWQAGDKVWGRNDAGSTLAEIVAVPAYALRKMKTDRTFVECATLGGPALLACRALQQAALDPDGKPKILVHGAHTGLGTFLIQFAKVC
jgi:NADPH:quinone reductase-like Zn-dependent oxidoreductase